MSLENRRRRPNFSALHGFFPPRARFFIAQAQKNPLRKVSSEQFSERFEQEARSVAALNHPNICTLFDVGPNYLVMELIEGSTLEDRIKLGGFPWRNR